MKRILGIVAVLLTALPIMAQVSVSGTVVDKQGNPLPGVKIEIPGTPDNAVSDLDGTFTLPISNPGKKKLVATYSGMKPSKEKIKEGMTVKMSEYGWWSAKPTQYNWFAEAIFAVPGFSDPFSAAGGVMFGRMKIFGWYAKFVTNHFPPFTEMKDAVGTRDFNGFLNKQRLYYSSLTAGGMVRLKSPIYLYAGVGYCTSRNYAENISGEWQYDNHVHYYNGDKDDEEPSGAFAVDLGLMMKIKRFTISIGTTGKCSEYGACTGNFGVGYTF